MAERLTVADVVRGLGEAAPFEKAAAWDPVGLQIGDPAAPAASVALCHEVTEAVIAAVEDDPIDLLIAYHPLLFRPLRSLVSGPTPAGRALRLARAGVSLAVVHTSLDVARGGAADALADALGLSAVVGFGPVGGPDSVKIVTFVPPQAADLVLDAVVDAGAATIGSYTHCSWRGDGFGTFHARAGAAPTVGRVGELHTEPEVRIEVRAPRACEAEVVAALVTAHPYEEPAYDVYDKRGDDGMLGRVGQIAGGTTLADLAERVRDRLARPALRVAGRLDRRVQRAAVVPGAGTDVLPAAVATRPDVIVTGDVAHHRARELIDLGISILDPGHVATERPGLERLLEWLRGSMPQTRSLLDLDPDPWLAHEPRGGA